MVTEILAIVFYGMAVLRRHMRAAHPAEFLNWDHQLAERERQEAANREGGEEGTAPEGAGKNGNSAEHILDIKRMFSPCGGKTGKWCPSTRRTAAGAARPSRAGTNGIAASTRARTRGIAKTVLSM